jgi:hypothetical protein
LVSSGLVIQNIPCNYGNQGPFISSIPLTVCYRLIQACRGNSASKSTVRKVSRQVSLAFIKRTLARCHKFEDTGSSCFSEPALQRVNFSAPICNNDTKSVGCVGSGTARTTCNEVSNIHAEARGSGMSS